MKKKNYIFLLALFILNGCSSEEKVTYENETLTILEDINQLAKNTFDKGKGIIDLINIVNESDPILKSSNKDEIIKNVSALARSDHKAKWIYDNFYNIDDIGAYLTGNDTDTVEFVYNDNNGITDFAYSEGESIDLDRSIPYYIQWDNRWAYKKLGQSNIGYAGCGPTSMAMVLSGLTDDPSISPDKLIDSANSYMVEAGISWSYFTDMAEKYSLNINDVAIDEASIIEALDKGPLIVSVGPGYFTLYGHIFVIESYQDGKFIINDPNSIKNTMRKWSYDEINDQILHIWNIF
ncbi:MAG: C39 family peptidase [Tissierellia bacterium]|nr:C39 family peptidase [Tissierellia bacterium]